MANVRGLGAIELGVCSTAADLGSKDGVTLAGVVEPVVSVKDAPSMRPALGLYR